MITPSPAATTASTITITISARSTETTPPPRAAADATLGALMFRIGYWAPFYYSDNKEPQGILLVTS